MPTPSAPTKPQRPARSQYLAICLKLAILVVAVVILSVRILAVVGVSFFLPRDTTHDKQHVQEAFAEVEKAALTGDESTVFRYCTEPFVLNASGANPGAAPRNIKRFSCIST